jgi:hypothetical protein
MIASPGKPDAVSLTSGLGRVRARTIAVGAHVIAIENIGTIRILRGQRSWWLFLLGTLVIAVAATQLNTYGAIAIAGIGLGVVLIIGDLAQKVESGLSVSTADGRSTLIVSRDQIFLQRLLQLFVDKIDGDDETLLATFDIASGKITVVGPAVEVGENVLIANEPIAPPPRATAGIPTAPAAPLPTQKTENDSDDGLFGDAEPANEDAAETAPQPAPEPKAEVKREPVAAPVVRMAAQAERRKSFDPLLDGGPKAATKDDDWLSPPGEATRSPQAEPEGGAARFLLALLVVALLGAGVFAAWYFTGQTGPATSISQIASPQETVAETSAAPMLQPIAQDALQNVAVDAPVAAVELSPATTPEPEPATIEAEDFTPPAPIVARASGLPYRAAPSTASDVPVLAETRAGGERLRINGRAIQPDGEWYRVMLPGDRTGWFKASHSVPRALFAQSIGVAAPGSNFLASSPQILEPAEGVQLGGGPQPVRLAWSHRDDASIYIVEIESFDTTSQRWIEDPLHKRVMVDDGTELSEDFPSAGAWRWRVRGVTADGQQSQFSRWSAFGIRN